MAFNKVKQIVVEEDFRHPESKSGLHFGPSLFYPNSMWFSSAFLKTLNLWVKLVRSSRVSYMPLIKVWKIKISKATHTHEFKIKAYLPLLRQIWKIPTWKFRVTLVEPQFENMVRIIIQGILVEIFIIGKGTVFII